MSADAHARKSPPEPSAEHPGPGTTVLLVLAGLALGTLTILAVITRQPISHIAGAVGGVLAAVRMFCSAGRRN
ncbi:hypothetical protein ACW14Y_07510 [Kitasatospora sp. cg17-2]